MSVPFMNNYPVYIHIHYVLTEGITRDKSLLWKEFIENIACTFVFRDVRAIFTCRYAIFLAVFRFCWRTKTYKVGIQDLIMWA